MTVKHQKIAVIGCGAWGTALAATLNRAGRDVILYARDAGLADTINAAHENKVYLPGIPLDKKIRATANAADVAGADIMLFVTPTQYVRDAMQKFAAYIPEGTPIVNCAKGIEISSGSLISEIANDILPRRPYAVLSGPNFAHEIAQGLPAAATLAGKAPRGDLLAWAEALRGPLFRPYISDDPVGAEVAGALKNVIAIACGMVEGKKMGQNTRAAVMTRGMAEIRRLGLHKGATAETFLGLSGLGDLTLTCNSMASRNFSLGAEIGAGKSLDDVLSGRKSVAEGVATAHAVHGYAEKNNIDMPIVAAVDAILRKGAKVDDVVNQLMSRALRDEKE